MDNVTLKTTLTHRYGQTVKTSVTELTFDAKGHVSVTVVQAAKLLSLGLKLEPVDAEDYNKKIKEFEKSAGKPINIFLDQVEETRASVNSETLQELLMREREEKVSLLSRIQELESQGGNSELELAIKGLKKQVLGLEAENKALLEENSLLKSLVEKESTDDEEIKTLSEEEMKEIEKQKLLTKLDSYKVDALQKLAEESQLPKAEWETLKKKDLIKYLADNIE